MPTSSRAPPSRHTLYNSPRAHTCPELHSYIITVQLTINASVLAFIFQHNCTFSPAKYSPQCTWSTSRTRAKISYTLFRLFMCLLIASLLEYSVWCFYKYFPFLQSAKRKNAFNTSTLLQIKHYTTVESFDAFACEMMKIEEPKILYKSHYGRENVTKRKANHRSFYVQTTKKKM